MVLALLLACQATVSDTAQPADQRLRAEGGRLLDAQGRQLLLRGLNARVEGLFDVRFDDGRTELEQIPPFGASDCAFMAEQLGHNLLRLPVNWSAIEPQPDAYDHAYLDAIVDLAAACHEAGVYTLVDLHQDAYSKEIGEDGAPLWAIVPEPTELLEGPLEDLSERRSSLQVLLAFQSLFSDAEWTEGETLQDAYADMAATLATAIDGQPGVVGLELMNEPVVFDDDKLYAFHLRVGEAVRAAAPDLPLVFEPDTIRNFSDSDPVDHVFPLSNAVYAPHVYTDVFTDGWAERDVAKLQASVVAAAAEADEHGAPLLVGELGHDPTTELGQEWITVAFDALDQLGAGWAFWLYEEWGQGQWGLYDPGEGPSRGALRADAADLLARPSPQAVDARLVGSSWDGVRLVVQLEDAGEGAHVIGVPARIWPDGVVVTCDGAQVETTAGPGRVEVRCSGSELVVRAGG